MGAASHLGIRLSEYDARIRAFIPRYAAMIAAAADTVAALAPRAEVIVDLGIGTGALASRCLRAAPRARVIGIDMDRAMLHMAGRRLGARLTPIVADFAAIHLPPCDVVVASLALHHVRSPRTMAALYRRACRALRPGGALVVADRYLASSALLAADDSAAWRRHLERRYSVARTRAMLRAWAKEDFYRRLTDEMALLAGAGVDVDVPWRHAGFAVVVGVKHRTVRHRT